MDPNSKNWLPTPVGDAAVATESTLAKIPLPPRPDTMEPKQLAAAAAAFAVAVRKLQHAEAELIKIKADQLARDQRVAMLKALLATMESRVIDVWCATYSDGLSVGAKVKTMEVPGHWVDDGENRISTLYEGTPQEKTVSYFERSFNIAPSGNLWPAIPSAMTGYPATLAPPVAQHGALVPAEALGDAQVFVNLALEPGNEKWRPLWRYGILTAVNQSADTATVMLNGIYSRAERGAAPADSLPLDEIRELSNVPIRYPPCNSRVFVVGDEVLVLFQAQNRANPVIIGFRREPRLCPRTWEQWR